MPTPRTRLLVSGLLGVLIGLIVLVSTVTEFRHVHHSDARATELSLAQRFHQDADQAHDALHADVLNLVRVAGRPEAQQAADTLNADGDEYQRDIDKVQSKTLPPAVAAGLSALRPVQLRYLATARRIGILAVANPSAATAALQDFDEDFLRLQGAQGTVTDQLAAVEQATRSTAARVQDGAERRIVITTALALVGLLIQALLLARAGHRLTAQLARERRIAETLQQGLLPDELPELPGLRLAGRFLPADTGVRVGGDWYDVVPIPSGGCYLVMGDVVGHDLAAAALMGQLRASVRSWTSENLAPAEVFTRLNRQLLAFDRDESATCLLLRLEDGGCGFANAGHLPPLLLDADGNGSYLEGLPCPPLGAVRDFPYQQYETLLPPGATLLLYTDGLVERRGTDLDQRLDALKAAATQVAACCPGDVDPEQLCSHLVRTMCGSEKPVDDVTLLAVTLAGTPAPWLSSSTNRV